ncbi:hypothetical protein [Micrococcus luteus]|uniref:hypothetical protein n=1 Tax=Micrococcus luteus TaxID=1270 RepID=UPI00119D9E9C|nr:hypothetical protein [Micrococcus luteus]
MDAKPTRLRKKATREEILASLPVQARVRPARWLFLWLIVVVGTAVFVWVIFRPPEDVSAGFGVWRVASFIGLALALAALTLLQVFVELKKRNRRAGSPR